LTALFLTVSILLFAALTVHPRPDLMGLLGVLLGITNHCHVYVPNNVIDRDLDATVPGLDRKPPIRGPVSTGLALALVVMQLPLSFVLMGFFFGDRFLAASFLWLASLVMMTLHNLYGKRFPLSPILADVLIGLWAALLYLFGVVAVGGAIDRVAVSLSAFVIIWPTYINGFHCRLRGVHKDCEFGVRTTPIWLGIRLQDGRLLIPRALRVYALGLQAVITIVAYIPWAANWLGRSTRQQVLTDCLLTLASIPAFLTLIGAPK
jgi:4-hydroxybenzoate polyprenyltransferase